MGLICSATCCPTTGKPPVPFKICLKNKVKYDYTHIIIGDCAYQFTDITDPVEWKAALDAGSIQCLPIGTITINEPTETVVETNNIGGEDTVDGTYVIDYKQLYGGDSGTGEEEDFYYDLKKTTGTHWLMILDARGNFIMHPDYIEALANAAVTVVGRTPGYTYSIPKTPHPINENGLRVWSTQFSIEEAVLLRGRQLAGVPAVLCC